MRFEMKIGIASLAIVSVAACAPVDPGFGEAVRYDMAAQTIDPDPNYSPDGAKPGSSGTHGAKAAENYRKGKTKPIRQESTSSGGSGGGSGGGGAGTPGTR